MITLFLFLVQFMYSCDFGGEYNSICNIEYQSDFLNAEILVDSLVVLNPELEKSIQNKYEYNISDTGYKQKNLFFWFEKNHYVISIAYYTFERNQKLKIVNFGQDGDVLRKFDGLSKSELKFAERAIREVVLTELESRFTDITFICNCG